VAAKGLPGEKRHMGERNLPSCGATLYRHATFHLVQA
jgi:hypothetical protein